MLIFIVFLGKAIQCSTALGCTPIPFEAVQELIRFGVLELVLETGVYSYYAKRYKKNHKDE